MMISNSKKLQKHKKHVHHSFRARGTVSSLRTSMSLIRNMNVKVIIELFYIFSKISKFKYWYLFIDAEYISCCEASTKYPKLFFILWTSILNTLILQYTMHNKFSNHFECLSPSTSDLELHLLALRYKHRSSDKNFHIKKHTELPNAAIVLKWRSVLRLAGYVGISDLWVKPKPLSSDCLVTENPNKHSKCCTFLNFFREINGPSFHNLTFLLMLLRYRL